MVVVDHHALQEQGVDLLHGERYGFGLVPALCNVRTQERQGGGLVAVVGQHRFADANGDGQDHDVVGLDEILRQVARRIHGYTNAHEAPPRAGMLDRIHVRLHCRTEGQRNTGRTGEARVVLSGS